MSMTRSCGAWAACLALVGSVAAAEPAGGRLDVAGGGLAGDLVPVGSAPAGVRDTILWRSPRFTDPFEFRVGEISGIVFPQVVAAAAAGPFVQLRGGDVVVGTVESLDADAVVVSTAGPDGPQRLRIARAEVAAIARTAGGGSSYVGPVGLADWTQVPPDSWREEAGRILSDSPGASVTRDVRAPARARYSIRLSRRGATEFKVAVAAAARAEDDGYFLQTVGTDVMLVRRANGKAELEPLPATVWRGDALHVVLFVDQERGRVAVVFPDAEAAEDRKPREVTLPQKPPQTSGRFRVELGAGAICLERLEVTPWRGDQPTLGDASATTIVTREATLEGFTLSAFEAGNGGTYVLTRGGETKRVPAADVEEIRFPDGGGPEADHALRVVRADGGSLSGDLVEVDEQAVWLRRRGIDSAVAVPRSAITAIRSLRPTAQSVKPEGRVGTLIVGEDRTRGWLATNAAGLAWWPLGSTTSAGFAEPLASEVEYVRRSAKQGVKNNAAEVGGIGGQVVPAGDGSFIVAMLTDDGAAAQDGRLQPGDRLLAIAPAANGKFVETKGLDQETVMHLLRGRIGTAVRLKVVDATGANPREIELARGTIAVAGDALLEQALQVHLRLAGGVEAPIDAKAEFPALVVLRSGDVSPCRVEAIDGDVIVLRSPLAGGNDAVRVPTSLVKAVELIPKAPTRRLSKTLRDRLLTLPRMQRDRPPTHVLRLLDGDYVRGRLVRADDRTIRFEVLDVAKDFPRESVARIIWLHPDVPRPDGEEPPAEAEEPAAGEPEVQSVAADGRRFTLVAESVDGDTIRGRSAAFGESCIDLTKADRLLLGAAVGRDAGSGTFADWVLKPAPEPRALAKPEAQ